MKTRKSFMKDNRGAALVTIMIAVAFILYIGVFGA